MILFFPLRVCGSKCNDVNLLFGDRFTHHSNETLCALTCACAHSVQAGGKTHQFSSLLTLGCYRGGEAFPPIYYRYWLLFQNGKLAKMVSLCVFLTI